jgi:hypothetical protein
MLDKLSGPGHPHQVANTLVKCKLFCLSLDFYYGLVQTLKEEKSSDYVFNLQYFL